MITVNVVPTYSTGVPVTLDLENLSTVGSLYQYFGDVPQNSVTRVNGVEATPHTKLGNGDRIMISASKYDAG